MKKILLDKEYCGFESWVDIDRDVAEMWDGSDIPGEGQGKIVVKIEYIEEEKYPLQTLTAEEIVTRIMNCRDQD